MPEIHAEEFYNEDYYSGTMDDGIGFDVLNDENLANSSQSMDKRIEWLLAERKVGSFLDVGCGVGLLVEAAHRHGIKAFGVDSSPFAIEYGRTKLGIEGLKSGFFQNVLSEDEKFDVIYLNHVIEHVPDPKELVADCAKFLTDGGWLIMETPDIDSSQSRKAGKDWEYILPEHLYYFNLPSLSRLCEANSLSVQFAEKEVGSTGTLNAVFGGEDQAREFYDRWLRNAPMQLIIGLVRRLYARVGQKIDVDYKYIKVVAEK